MNYLNRFKQLSDDAADALYGLIKDMGKVQQDVETIRQEFNSKYGTDNVNIQDGTIAYPEENGEADKED